MSPPLWLVLVGMEFPAALAFLDCIQRPADHFADGASDRRSWIRWLVVAIVLVPVFLGYAIVLGYYYAVIRRNAPGGPR